MVQKNNGRVKNFQIGIIMFARARRQVWLVSPVTRMKILELLPVTSDPAHTTYLNSLVRQLKYRVDMTASILTSIHLRHAFSGKNTPMAGWVLFLAAMCRQCNFTVTSNPNTIKKRNQHRSLFNLLGIGISRFEFGISSLASVASD